MLTTIIYNSTGGIIMTTSQTGMGAVSSIEYDIPDGYTVSSVNVETGEPVLEEIPKTDEQKQIDSLKTAAYALASVSTTLTDEQALSMPEFFAEWEPNTKYVYGQVISRNGQLYRVEQSEVTSIESQPPEAEGMLAVYRLINPSHTGALDDPIPWVYGMDCHTGEYFSYNGKVYKCAGDMIPCVWEPGSAGLWQWEEVTE